MLRYKKSLSALSTTALALMMTACNSSTPPLPRATKLPADLMQPCSSLQPLQGNTGADVLPWALGMAHQYNDCKARHNALVRALE